MRSVKTLLAILRGEAVVLIKKDERNADVVVGCSSLIFLGMI